jgi:ATP-dependent RNA helicase DDX1
MTGNQKVELNENDRDSTFAIGGDGLLSQSRSEQWAGARANFGVSAGAYYYEAEIHDNGLCRVGWSTKSAKLDLGTCEVIAFLSGSENS